MFGIPNTAFLTFITVSSSISYVKKMIGLFIIRILYNIYKIIQNKRGTPIFIDSSARPKQWPKNYKLPLFLLLQISPNLFYKPILWQIGQAFDEFIRGHQFSTDVFHIG